MYIYENIILQDIRHRVEYERQEVHANGEASSAVVKPTNRYRDLCSIFNF